MAVLFTIYKKEKVLELGAERPRNMRDIWKHVQNHIWHGGFSRHL